MKVLVVGAGFAGVWAAAGAARQREQSGLAHEDLQITLVAPGPNLVIRPRLYEENPEGTCVPLSRILTPADVTHLSCTVTRIDPEEHTATAVMITGEDIVLGYDRLVLASGSRLRRPSGLPGHERLKSVDTLDEAIELDAHLRSLPSRAPTTNASPASRYTAVVVGASFTGLEIATTLVGRLQRISDQAGARDNPRVVLVERRDAPGGELGPGLKPCIDQALGELGIEVLTNTTVARVEAAEVILTNGQSIPAQTAIWAAGMTASNLTQQFGVATDSLGRLPVDEYLQVHGVPDVFAAGDTAAAMADANNHVLQSCQHAIPQGKYAGHNAVASLCGSPMERLLTNPYVTCLDLGGWGAVFTKGWDRQVDLTREDGQRRKELINRSRIYPPVDDRAELFRQADLVAYQLGTTSLV